MVEGVRPDLPAQYHEAVVRARANLLELVGALRELGTTSDRPAGRLIEVRTPDDLAELALAGAPVELIAECFQALEGRDEDREPVAILAGDA